MFYKIYFASIEITNSIKYFFQKIFRGYSNPEAYDFFYHHAEYCIPRLRRLKEYGNSCPIGMPIRVWHGVLDTMIETFQLILGNDDKKLTVYEQDKVQNGLELFAAHYLNLWD